MEFEINSLLDTDLYKLTMMQAVLHRFNTSVVKYQFQSRSSWVRFTIDDLNEITSQIKHLETLSLTQEEKEYLTEYVPFLTTDYIEYLSHFKFDVEKYVSISFNSGTQKIDISIEGPWLQTILFEVPILAILSSHTFKKRMEQLECKNNNTFDDIKKFLYHGGILQIHKKTKNLVSTGFSFADFGTRRRSSAEWHLLAIEEYNKLGLLSGTSNVFLAKKLGIKPIGTMAHEFIQAGQAFVHPRDSQKFMLNEWCEEYQGDLGIALSDTLTFDYFIHDFNAKFAKLYDGVRLDSGDPEEQAYKLIKHYNSLKINPLTKTIVFSDGLDLSTAYDLYIQFKDLVKTSFGIGTNITHILPNIPSDPLKKQTEKIVYTAPQFVIKMVKCDGLDVAKISDTPAKTICQNQTYITYLKTIIRNTLFLK